MRARHYWRRRLKQVAPESIAPAVCDAPGTVGMLSREPQARLSCFDRWIAFLTTPFKRLGISGWKETGCDADATGRPVRDAQHSTDGFWTIDVRLDSFAIGSAAQDPSHANHIRVEVEPDTRAHAVCARTPILEGTLLSFGGAVVIDTDGPFLEVHPEDDFRVLEPGAG
jgi:hypothetical protein